MCYVCVASLIGDGEAMHYCLQERERPALCTLLIIMPTGEEDISMLELSSPS
jgi:hypothetical protein